MSHWNRSPVAAFSGPYHHVAIHVSTPIAAAATNAANASCVHAQRRRETPWVQTNETVSSSSSRAIAGAPQNMPTTIGTNVNRARPNRRIVKKRAANACASS
ncbi:MAG: hypothetical protein ACRDHI_03440 [Actinomycetota bacterium]